MVHIVGAQHTVGMHFSKFHFIVNTFHPTSYLLIVPPLMMKGPKVLEDSDSTLKHTEEEESEIV
jgi:hypothetical protein